MKKLFVLIAFLLAFTPAFASPDKSTTTEVAGYIISVQESGATIRVQVRSVNNYGVSLAYSKSRNSYQDNENVKYLTAGFEVKKELKKGDAIKASDVYSVKFPKGMKTKVYMTIKTGALSNMHEQIIWQKTE